MISNENEILTWKITLYYPIISFVFFYFPYLTTEILDVFSIITLTLFIVVSYFFLEVILFKGENISIYRLLRIHKIKLVIPYKDIVSVKVYIGGINSARSITIKYLNENGIEKRFYLTMMGLRSQEKKIINILKQNNCYIYLDARHYEFTNLPPWLQDLEIKE